MKLFIDSANLEEIEAAARTGLVDGVTTNPSLIAKSGKKFEDVLRRICELVNGSVSAEVTATDYDGMMKEAKPLTEIHKNITIKVPLTIDGLRTCQSLSQKGVAVNVTLCFSAVQALMAAKAGATYISPFIGRLDDIGQDGMKLIRDIKEIYSNYPFRTQILVASVRHPEHILQAARIGADVSTLPYAVFTKLFEHPLTKTGLAQFLKDWESVKKTS